MSDRSEAVNRGRGARHPTDIPTSGWRDIVFRVKDAISRDNLSVVAAGVAFYGLLALVPGVAALVSLYGLVMNPEDVQHQLESLGGWLPAQAQRLIHEQLASIVGGADASLSLGFLSGLAVALWSAAKGTKALIASLNIVYRTYLKIA